MNAAWAHVSRFGMQRAAFAMFAALIVSGACRAEDEARSLASANVSLKMSDAIARDAARVATAPREAITRDYRIGSEDLLEIQVFGVDQLSRTVRVNTLGMISLPLIGNLEVGGLTAQEAEALVADRLTRSYLQNPQVSLFIKEYTTQRVTVEGAVARPGIYPLRGPTTLLRSLALAGGQASLSDMSEVMLFRQDTAGHRETKTYDVERIRRGELDDPIVLNDDLIVVNRSAGRVLFKDSILRDVIDTINPFSPLMPH